MGLRLFFTALEYFTRIPKPAWVGFEPDWLARSAPWLPVVGALIGFLLALIYQVVAPWFGHSLGVVAILAGSLLLTGAFHEDGWADSCDALGAGGGRERMLEIMHDSRLGTYGVAGLLVMLLAKFETLRQLPPSWLLPTVVLAHLWSRVGPLAFMVSLPYVRSEGGKAKPVVEHLRWGGLIRGSIAAALITLLILAFWVGLGHYALIPLSLLLAAGLCLLVQALWGFYIMRRLGGYTGDLLGAAQQLGELAFVLGVLAVGRWLFGL